MNNLFVFLYPLPQGLCEKKQQNIPIFLHADIVSIHRLENIAVLLHNKTQLLADLEFSPSGDMTLVR